jgi:catechol 2,3-dioxygenase-like lactoylglutathione lyase family enzyme
VQAYEGGTDGCATRLALVIRAVHTLLYSTDPAATRAFLRDVLGWPHVAEPEDPDWLIFKAGPSEMGVHPTSGEYEREAYASEPHHEISHMCDDVAATRAEIEAKGATFSGPIEDMGFGLGTTLEVPGAGGVLLYEPRHPVAHSLP